MGGFVVGVSAQNELKTFTWGSNSSIIVCGMNGSGKTMGTAYWMYQLAAQGVRFLVVDPHAQDKQSLVSYTKDLEDAYIGPPIDDYKDIPDAIEWFHQLGRKRLEDTTLERWPLALVIDEFTSFVLRKDDKTKRAVTLLLDAVNQYRKCSLLLVVCGQSWGKAASVASSLRDASGCSIVFKSSLNDASKFCSYKHTQGLKPGYCVYEEEIVKFPMITATDRLMARDIIAEFNYTQDIYPEPITAKGAAKQSANELLLESLLSNAKP